MRTAYVYIMGSASGTLYIGITNNLERRVWEHKRKVNEGFTKRHDVINLLYMEEFSRFDDAIAREKQLQRWSRSKKLNLIRTMNPRWNDLAWNWYGDATVGQDEPE
jgi:putative endonuclease